MRTRKICIDDSRLIGISNVSIYLVVSMKHVFQIRDHYNMFLTSKQSCFCFEY